MIVLAAKPFNVEESRKTPNCYVCFNSRLFQGCFLGRSVHKIFLSHAAQRRRSCRSLHLSPASRPAWRSMPAALSGVQMLHQRHHVLQNQGAWYSRQRKNTRRELQLHHDKWSRPSRYCGTCNKCFHPAPYSPMSPSWGLGRVEGRASVDKVSHKYPCHTYLRSYHSHNISGLNRPWTGGRIPVLATSSTLYQW